MVLDALSRVKLREVHPDLVKVIHLAATYTQEPFRVTEGLRTRAQQLIYVKRGLSKTMNSRHLWQKCGFACAADLAPLTWAVHPEPKIQEDLRRQQCHRIAKAMDRAADELQLPVKWGGDWKVLTKIDVLKVWHWPYYAKFWFDGPHYELDRASYP